MSLTSTVNIGEDYDTLSHKLGYRLEDLILQKLSSKSVITIGVSGGSMIDLLALMLPRLQLPWARLRIFFVDESFVPFTSDMSTYGNYQAKLFRQLPIIEQNIIKINPNLSTVEQCAEDYQKQLENLLNEDKVFDIVMLGMGPDGHTASLFPNHPASKNDNEGLVIYVKDSPQSPAERVTLTLKTINQAKYKLVVVTGANKSSIVKDVLKNKNPNYPISQVKNPIWFLDKNAAKEL